jgi:CheY-like chemotaxis protein
VEFQNGMILVAGGSFPNPMHLRTSESDSEGGGATQIKVLVVDDERLLADTTAAILRRSGFEAKTAYDGFNALEMALSFSPNCLLTDIMMPGMNGVELAIAVTKLYPHVKTLLFSGQAGISDILRQSKEKGYEFPLLAKPVHPLRLVEQLKDLRSR